MHRPPPSSAETRLSSPLRGYSRETLRPPAVLPNHSSNGREAYILTEGQMFHIYIRLRIIYLDDGTLGGNLADVLCDFHLVAKEAVDISLHLNRSNSELLCEDPITRDQMLKAVPGLQMIGIDQADLQQTLLESSSGPTARACLLAGATKESGHGSMPYQCLPEPTTGQQTCQNSSGPPPQSASLSPSLMHPL